MAQSPEKNDDLPYMESKIHRNKSQTEKQIEQESLTGITDIDTLLIQMKQDVDQIASDFVEFDTCIETRVMDMIHSSKEHMEWLKNTAHSTSVIAQKASDHAEIFKQECTKLNEKCKKLDSFEAFLAQIQTKVALLETSADALIGEKTN
mmetsp:Transcript_10441/g.15692  ORF Transcript_10441/g.15692 Transcript_10441/m.15692 type:complete len:149 (+) Transcript_10441:19-465(+)